jgi:hypothetical protein
MAAYKLVGHNSAVSSSALGAVGTRGLSAKFGTLLGSEFTEASLRVKSEILKSARQTASATDLLSVQSKLIGGESVARPQFAVSVSEFFSKFRIAETTRRMLSATKSVILPDTAVIRAQITSADVIHS